MDELLRPFEYGGNTYTMNVKSVSIMGKAGILTGEKGDIMILLLTFSKEPQIIIRLKTL